jgi:hypothetical protein
MSKSRNVGMPEKSYSGIGIFTGIQPSQSGVSIPASGSVWYRWSRISPALPSYALNPCSVYVYFLNLEDDNLFLN